MLVAGFFLAYLDRVNISFAALTMNRELGFSPDFFGFAAGIFFVGYCLFETPSNYLMHRIGARIWIARIMVSWGVVSLLGAFIWNGASFVALRLLLGVAEAGFAPGVILYLTYWIPAAQRARAMGLFLLAVPLSSAIGAPVSSLIMSAMDGVAGFSGWRWLFFIEALPSIALGFACFIVLPDGPDDADWLADNERAALKAQLNENDARAENLWRALTDSQVLKLGVAYFGLVVALYGVGFWLPQIIASLGFGVVASGFLTAAPYAVGAGAMAHWSRSSDRAGEQQRHTASAMLLAGCGLAASGLVDAPWLAMLALAFASIGTLAAMPTFWSHATLSMDGARAIVGVAAINSIGNLAGFVAPSFVGWAKSATGDYRLALLGLSLGPALTAFLLLRARR